MKKHGVLTLQCTGHASAFKRKQLPDDRYQSKATRE